MSAGLTWPTALVVALGAAIGALLRWLAAAWVNPLWPGFPLGTLLVNGVGGLLIGLALVGFEHGHHEIWRAFFITGFLGGLTTFSAFSGESIGLLQRGHIGLALGHAAAHVLGSLACVALGMGLARWAFKT